jgi:hypothetical protein
MIKIELHDGLYWDEHSDYIVGNKQGLMELKNIIDKAKLGAILEKWLTT